MKYSRYTWSMLLILALFVQFAANAQKRGKVQDLDAVEIKSSPKLVVGIVVDQMRYDYLTRFYGHYGNDGFKRFINEGFNCKNNHYNYAPTSTGPGHASVYTGTSPAMHGIIGNNWYDKVTGTSVYCAGDNDYASVGTASDEGKMSPHRMNVSTVTDELRLHTQMRGKTIAISLKDRGAVLPGGHTANAAYWFNGGDEGNWITSTFYMAALPKWVQDFNSAKKLDQYIKPWTALKEIGTYVESGPDNNNYEGLITGETAPIFPHDLPKYWNDNGKYDLLRSTPFGNNMVTDFALEAIEKELLGFDDHTDFLAISYSSTDYVGHQYGVNSKEVQDTYIRLDGDLEQLFNALDKRVGKGQYLVFLTSDHGAVEVPGYLKDQKLPADYFDFNALKPKFNEFLEYTFGTTDIVKNMSNDQVFLDHAIIKNLDLDLANAQDLIAKELLSYPNIEQVYTAAQMQQNQYTSGLPYILQNGYNQKRSGDVLFVLKPGVASYSRTGSTHGSPHIYDTHVPLLFFGKGIKNSSTVTRTEITDIAPTVSALLGISFPSGTTGKPIAELFD